MPMELKRPADVTPPNPTPLQQDAHNVCAAAAVPVSRRLRAKTDVDDLLPLSISCGVLPARAAAAVVNESSKDGILRSSILMLMAVLPAQLVPA